MKKLLISAAIAAGFLGAGLIFSPATASNEPAYDQTDCEYATNHTAGVVGVEAEILPPNSNGGMAGTADIAVGACLDSPVFGGALEVGVGGLSGISPTTATCPGSPVPPHYVIADGDNGNPGQSVGYVGLSNYEDRPPRGTRNGAGNNPGNTNSGCDFGDDATFLPRTGNPTVDAIIDIIDPPGALFIPKGGLPLPIACGFTSGPSWNGTNRDGCSIP